MKNILPLGLAILTLVFSNGLSGQTIYNITKNTNISATGIPEQCSSCIINIADGATLTINKDVFMSNVTFNGGNLNLPNKAITFWAPGAFNSVNIVVDGKKGGIISSGTLAISNSHFIFKGESKATYWAPVTLTSSTMKFLDDAGMESTSSFDLINNSSLSAGDGGTSSEAYIMFNGGTLNEYDNSYVTISNLNNYYYNWSPYHARSINKSYNTTWNTMNCGTPGKNTCSGPKVYGPATLNFAGFASSAVLPVKLSAFDVQADGKNVNITWTTDMEMNAAAFDIERSVDGVNWVFAGTLKANGNVFTASHYSFIDAQKFSGSMYYRLKMTDIDGTYAYSPVRSVITENEMSLGMYPNPAAHQVTISSPERSSKVSVQLINQAGQVLKLVHGSGNIILPVNEFNAGQYFVRVTTSTGTGRTLKLTIKK